MMAITYPYVTNTRDSARNEAEASWLGLKHNALQGYASTRLYNYGYRDYQPQTARFTTVDPMRDGNNWYACVNSDPVNWVDLWGVG